MLPLLIRLGISRKDADDMLLEAILSSQAPLDVLEWPGIYVAHP
jgi:hypothetical protein